MTFNRRNGRARAAMARGEPVGQAAPEVGVGNLGGGTCRCGVSVTNERMGPVRRPRGGITRAPVPQGGGAVVRGGRA